MYDDVILGEDTCGSRLVLAYGSTAPLLPMEFDLGSSCSTAPCLLGYLLLTANFFNPFNERIQMTFVDEVQFELVVEKYLQSNVIIVQRDGVSVEV